MQQMRIVTSCLGLAAMLLIAVPATAQIVTGYLVQDYATVDKPVQITFDPTGVMYAGRERPLVDPIKISRIGVGGTPVTEYGNVALTDPDAVLYDGAGVISGVPGSVLVAGMNEYNVKGSLWAIHPDESVTTLFADDTSVINPNVLKFDSSGRLVILENNTGTVFSYTGGTPTSLYSIGNFTGGMTIDGNDDIYTSAVDGVIRIHDSTGALIDNNFATIPGGLTPEIEFGPGNAWWGDDLYAIDRSSGDLLRIDDLGAVTTIGSGFDSGAIASDIEFGPDGAMYVSFLNQDRVIRIIPEPATMALLLIGGLALRRRR